MIHTVQSTLSIMNSICHEIIPKISLLNLLDEGIVPLIQQETSDYENSYNRLLRHIYCLEENKVNVILIVCNSLSSIVDGIKSQIHIPIVKIDEVMIFAAIKQGRKIGIFANVELSAHVLKEQMEKYASSIKADVELIVTIDPRSLIARQNGDIDEHDRLIIEKIIEMVNGVDVLVLAQASLSTALKNLNPAAFRIPVLSSPRLAVEKCKEIFDSG